MDEAGGTSEEGRCPVRWWEEEGQEEQGRRRMRRYLEPIGCLSAKVQQCNNMPFPRKAGRSAIASWLQSCTIDNTVYACSESWSFSLSQLPVLCGASGW